MRIYNQLLVLGLLFINNQLFALVPIANSMTITDVNNETIGLKAIKTEESVKIKIDFLSDGGKVDTKRKYFASKNGIKGQGRFGIFSPNEAMWEAPDIEGVYTVGAYLENSDGKSIVFTQDITVNNTKGDCPINFVYIPNSQNIEGSPLGWCVMKYEATPYNANAGWVKDDTTHGWVMQDSYEIDATKNITSAPNQSTINYVSGNNARGMCANRLVDTMGNQLQNGSPIKYNIWKILAKDIASNPDNWSSGVVGSGYIYSGHNDNFPPYALQATDDDLDGYYDTNNTSDNQRRTLFTSSGEAIWDLAGNFWEQTYEGQKVGDSNLKEYNLISANAFSPTTVIGSSASSWNSSNGIGISYGDNTNNNLNKLFSTKVLYALRIGGAFSSAVNAGLFTSSWEVNPIETNLSDSTVRCIVHAY